MDAAKILQGLGNMFYRITKNAFRSLILVLGISTIIIRLPKDNAFPAI